MAIDNSGQLSAVISEYLLRQSANNAGIDTNSLINLVNDFLPQGEQVETISGTSTLGVYKRFNALDTVTGKVQVVTEGLWTGGTGSLELMYTSSAQNSLASSKYYYDVYNEPSSSVTTEVQFAVAYGDVNGFGAATLGDDDNATLPTIATYSQYRNILLEPTDTRFTFLSSSGDGTHDSDDIYVINVQRARYREKLDPGNLEIAMSGSNGLFRFIDDSGKKIDDTVGKAGRVFNIVSGTLNLGSAEATVNSSYDANGQGFGLFYPDVGIIILNPAALGTTVGLELTASAAVDGTPAQEYPKNHKKLFNALKLGTDFQARRTENVSTSHYFVRANNREFNFSNNPTFTTGSDGSFAQASFEGDPKTYMTSVGLYNNSNELLAIAKLSQPTPKSFDQEVLIKVRLDF